MSVFDDLRQQTAQSSARRQALRLRAAQTVDRLAPGRLAEDAVDAVAGLASETGERMRAHPGTTAAVLAVAAIALFHRPLGRLVDHWLDRFDPPGDEPAPPVEDGDAEPVSDG